LRKSHLVPVYASVEALLASVDVDAVLIAAPHHLLAPTALSAIRAGKHVLVEKPVALNAHEGEQLEAEAERSGVICMPGYSLRFSMGSYLKALLSAAGVGEITTIIGSFCVGPMNEGWRAHPETGGGPLLYVGCHLIDLVLWLTAQHVTNVSAHVRRRADTGTDESSVIQLGLERGGVAVLFVTQAAPAVSYELQILGRSGSVALRGHSLAHFELEVVSKAVPTYAEPTTIRPSVVRDHISTMLVPELQEFAQAIRNQRPASITPADGMNVLRILDAIAESERTGQRVVLGVTALTAH
jgi:predicted dehydrogenase